MNRSRQDLLAIGGVARGTTLFDRVSHLMGGGRAMRWVAFGQSQRLVEEMVKAVREGLAAEVAGSVRADLRQSLI